MSYAAATRTRVGSGSACSAFRTCRRGPRCATIAPTRNGDPADGDKILVNKLYFHLYEPDRWQVAVFEKSGEDRNLIKRIVGLPNEEFDIRQGDIYVDGTISRKPREVQDDLLVPVFFAHITRQ